MAAVVQLEEVQAWLEQTKLTINNIDDDLANQFRSEVFAALATAYDTTGWTTASNTPELVRKIVAMNIAGAIWMRQYAEVAAEPDTYGMWLMSRAQTLLDGIINGGLTLVEDPAGGETPEFWPNDTTGAAPVYDALGNLVSVEGSEEIKFTMGYRF